MILNTKLQFAAIFLLMSVFLLPNIVNAQEEDCDSVTINIIARDPYGDYIGSVNVKIYEQVEDADGAPRPGKEVASGKTSNITGIYSKKFSNPSGGNYAVKLWKINSNEGAFWFYDNYIGCFSETIFTFTLSAIDVVIRDGDDELVKNKKFKLYTQRYDADEEPMKEKQDLVGEFNTSEEGEVVVYVPDSSRAMTGEGPEHYVFVMAGPMGGTFEKYNLYVNDGSMTPLNYQISDAEIYLKDANNIAFPGNTKITMYEQDVDYDENDILGEKLKDLYTDDNGRILWQYPEGVYAAKIIGENNKTQKFWNIEIFDEQREIYYLKTESNWEPNTGACEAASNLTIITSNLSGTKISGLKFAMYEEEIDINNLKTSGNKLVSGNIDELGKKTLQINPDPTKKYALKIYDKNDDLGDFWYYDGFQFVCGEDVVIERSLPTFKVITRNGDMSLKKNQEFSVYTQKLDVDYTPIKEKQDLVASDLNTSNEGEYIIYLAPDHPYDQLKKGTYVFTSKSAGATFTEYDINIEPTEDYLFEYIFSDLVVNLMDANGKYQQKTLYLYAQNRNAKANYELGKELKSVKSNEKGLARFEYPSGYYALAVKDSLGKNNIFWNIRIKNRARTEKDLKTNLTKVAVKDASGAARKKGAEFDVFSMTMDENGYFYKNKKLKTFKLEEGGIKEVSLAPGPYLIANTQNKKEYGNAIYTENFKFQEVLIYNQPGYEIGVGQGFKLEIPAGVNGLAERLKGYILLQVEELGEAWYVDHDTEKRYYMKDGATAYEMMRHFGLGITTENLEKIPVGIDDRFETFDYDGDFVFDKMEEAIGTDMYMYDTDGDGFDDGTELKNDYNPKGEGAMSLDLDLRDRLLGKILLQVESRGEAWYVNPRDGRRYYMPDGEAAYEIMRFLSLGITNDNLDQIEIGYLNIN